MDLFEQWLNRKESKWIQRALVDPSYNSYRCRGIKKNHPQYEELHTPIPENTDLALLGDSIVKFIYSDHLLDSVELLTIEKSKIESDKCFVEKVAKHYDLLSQMKKDPEDKKLPDDYTYDLTPGVNKNRHKYIAT